MVGGGPALSVVLPTRGRPEALWRAVRSVLDSTWADLELIVSDDEPGTGSAWGVLRRLAAADRRVRPTRNPGRAGQCANTNHAMSLARAPWIKLLHDDDVLMPECLATMHGVAAAADPGVVLVTCGHRVVRGPGGAAVRGRRGAKRDCAGVWRYRGDEAIRRMCLHEDPGGTVPSTMLVRRDAVEAGVEFEDAGVLHSAVDSWFKARLLTRGDMVHIGAPLVMKHNDDRSSITNTIDRRALDAEFEALCGLVRPLAGSAAGLPSTDVLRGQVRLIRAMHRVTRGRPIEGVRLAASVRSARAWWLAWRWGVRRCVGGGSGGQA